MTVPMFRWDVAAAGGPAFRDMGMAWATFMGLPQGGSKMESLADYAKAPANEAWVYSCIRRRYTAAMGVPLVVYVKDGTRRVSAEQSTNQAAKDLQALLDDVNPVDMQAGDLKAYLEAGLSAWGEGYIKKVRGRLGGPPKELYWLPATDVEPDPPQGPQPISGYRYQPNGLIKAEVYPVKDVVAFRYVNLANPRRGLSPLEAIRSHMRVSAGVAENTAATLENWGIPPGAWVVPKGADISPQDQRLIKRVISSLRGPRNQGKTPVLPEGIEFKPISLNQKDADWLGAGKVSRMTICAALGVPLVLAGDDDKASVYASIRDAERVFWRNTMIPELDWIADGLNSWLVPDFTTNRDIVIAFDYNGIEALRAAPAEELAQWLIATDKGLPINRVIERFGMGDPIDGGDESRVLLRTGDVGLTPEDQNSNAAPAPTPAPAAKPRPAEYNTARAAAASLGKGLYRHDAVKAYLASGDPTVLEQLVPEDEVERLALGLQKRLPASKLVAEWEPPDIAGTLAAVQDRVEGQVKAIHDAMKAQAEAQAVALSEATDRLERSLKAMAADRPEPMRPEPVVVQVYKDVPPPEVQTVERDETGRVVRIRRGPE